MQWFRGSLIPSLRRRPESSGVNSQLDSGLRQNDEPKHFLIGLLLGLIALTIPPMGYAQQHTHHGGNAAVVSGPPKIETGRVPTASFDVNGRLWLAWLHGQHIYVNYSDDMGKSFSSPVKVNPEPEKIHHNGEARPKIVVDRLGRIFVAYTQKLPKRFTGNIRFSRSVDGGKNFSVPLTVNDNLDVISHRFVSMALDADDKLHLVWLDGRDFMAAKKKGQEYNGSALYYSVSADHGASFQSNTKLADYTCQCCRIAMALDDKQQPVILWRHIFANDSDDGINRDHAILSLSKGNVVQRVSFENWAAKSCPHHGPALDIDSDGRYHMTWFNIDNGKPGLYYGHSDDQGKTVSAVYNFSGGSDQAQHPDLIEFNGKIFLIWKAFDGQQTTVWLKQSSDDGNSWSEEQSIAATDKQSDYPYLLKHGEHLYLSWHVQGEGYRLLEISGVGQ